MGYCILPCRCDPKCGGVVESIHPVQVIGTLILGFLALLIYGAVKGTK